MITKPLISFCLLSYNQEKYIAEAIKGAFMQTYSPLEIIISDDCSTDGTVEIIEKLIKSYNGKHLIKFNCNKQNLGLVPHFNDVVLNYCEGDYIVVAAGDDISYPDRTVISYNFIKNKKNTYAADFDVDKINNEGVALKASHEEVDSFSGLKDLLMRKKIKRNGCSRIYKRELFTVFGPLNNQCPTEDTPSVVRALLIGNLWFSNKKVLKYRMHNLSISSASNIYKLSLRQIFRQYLRDAKTAYKLNFITGRDFLYLIIVLSFNFIKRTRKNSILKKQAVK